MRAKFVNKFAALLESGTENGDTNKLNTANAFINQSFSAAAYSTLPLVGQTPRRPWVSEESIQLIVQRGDARKSGDYEREKYLNKAIKFSVKRDRAQWLKELAATGSWDASRRLCKVKRPAQGRLRALDGNLVSSEERADTTASYLEKVQWAVRPAKLKPDRADIGPELPVSVSDISDAEVERAVSKLRDSKAYGEDGLPFEYWKAVFEEKSESRKWPVDFCRQCWSKCCLPDDWHLVRVSTIYKKGDPADCQNYRPLSLLNISYKVFASILLNR